MMAFTDLLFTSLLAKNIYIEMQIILDVCE